MGTVQARARARTCMVTTIGRRGCWADAREDPPRDNTNLRDGHSIPVRDNGTTEPEGTRNGGARVISSISRRRFKKALTRTHDGPVRDGNRGHARVSFSLDIGDPVRIRAHAFVRARARGNRAPVFEPERFPPPRGDGPKVGTTARPGDTCAHRRHIRNITTVIQIPPPRPSISRRPISVGGRQITLNA